MHTFDHGVRGDDKPPPASAINEGCVIEQTETAGSSERRIKPPDAVELVLGISSHGS
jgi:hypothetical protein